MRSMIAKGWRAVAKVKAKGGRFIRIDFPAEGMDDTVDKLFLLNVLNAINLALVSRWQLKATYTGMNKAKREKKPSPVQGLRLVK